MRNNVDIIKACDIALSKMNKVIDKYLKTC